MKKFAIGLLGLVSTIATAQGRVVRFDLNNDGKIDYMELSAKCEVTKRLFEVADKNGDGVLSEAELRTAKAYVLDKCKAEEKNS